MTIVEKTRHDPDSLTENLKADLNRLIGMREQVFALDKFVVKLFSELKTYSEKAEAEIKRAKARPLELHNTARAIYEKQVLIIGELLDAIEDGDVPDSVYHSAQLLPLLDEGEEIVD